LQKNDKALKSNKIAENKRRCCYLLKTIPLLQAIEIRDWQTLVTTVC